MLPRPFVVVLLAGWSALLPWADGARGQAPSPAPIGVMYKTALSSLQIPLRYTPQVGYTMSVKVGTPPQEVQLALDTDNEGLRLFMPTTGLPSTFDPAASSSQQFCAVASPCLGLQRPYDCSSVTRDEEDVEYFQYELVPALWLNKVTDQYICAASTVCELRYEGLEDVSIPVVLGQAGPWNQAGDIQVLSAPVKFLRNFAPCHHHDNATRWHADDTAATFFGTLGLFGPKCRTPSFMDLALTRSGANLITLDLSRTNGTPTIRLSQEDPGDVPTTLWAELPQQEVFDLAGAPLFELYDPRLCGVELGATVSSHWACIACQSAMFGTSRLPLGRCDGLGPCGMSHGYSGGSNRRYAACLPCEAERFSVRAARAKLRSTGAIWQHAR